MANFVAKVRTIVLIKFQAGSPEEGKKIAPQKVWDVFDEIDALHDEIELEEIEDVIDVDADEDDSSDISFECVDGSVRKSDFFEVATLDGENDHPGMKRR